MQSVPQEIIPNAAAAVFRADATNAATLLLPALDTETAIFPTPLGKRGS